MSVIVINPPIDGGIGEVPITVVPTLDVATFNASLNRNSAGQLVTDLSTPNNAQAKTVAEIIQRAAPDIILINEFDYAPDALDLFRDNYLAVSQNGATAITDFAFGFIAPSNTGIASGFDLNNNGVAVTTPGAAGYGDDALGFGQFPGQFGMALYSRHEILYDEIRTFQTFLWKDMPGALLPDDPATPAPGDFYSAEELAIFRLSSKSHWDIPVRIDGEIVHILAAHPTPPVFDGPEDRNGKRNHDEIRFWSDYVTPGKGGYIYDDQGGTGGLAAGSRFVIVGDYNADPFDGDSVNGAINQLLANPLMDDSIKPDSLGGPDAALRQGGANTTHRGDPAFDTADFADTTPGNLRVDYVLGSKAGLDPVDGFVFWPPDEDPLFPLVGNFTPGLPGGFPSSDHRLVQMQFALVEEPEVAFRLWQDALFDGRGAPDPTARFRKQATDLAYTDGTGVGQQQASAPDDSTGADLARFNAAYGDVAIESVVFDGAPSAGGAPAMTLDWASNGVLIRLDLAWNAIKAIAIDDFTGNGLRVENFVDVVATLAGDTDRVVTLDGAKRGWVETGGGDDTVTIGADTNEARWSNLFTIDTGDGDDTITIGLASRNYVGGAYDGRFTSSTVMAGAGTDTVTGGAGRDRIDGGAGSDVITLGAGRDTLVVQGAEGDGDLVTDFAVGQDTILLQGFGPGASFALVGGVLVVSGPSATATITLQGVAALAADSVVFA